MRYLAIIFNIWLSSFNSTSWYSGLFAIRNASALYTFSLRTVSTFLSISCVWSVELTWYWKSFQDLPALPGRMESQMHFSMIRRAYEEVLCKIMDINEILEVTEITELGFSFKFSFRFRCVVVDVQALTLSMCRARYSSQRQLRSGLVIAVRPSVGWLVTDFPGEPLQGFFWFFAWMFLTIRGRNVHGRFSGKILVH